MDCSPSTAAEGSAPLIVAVTSASGVRSPEDWLVEALSALPFFLFELLFSPVGGELVAATADMLTTLEALYIVSVYLCSFEVAFQLSTLLNGCERQELKWGKTVCRVLGMVA